MTKIISNDELYVFWHGQLVFKKRLFSGHCTLFDIWGCVWHWTE